MIDLTPLDVRKKRGDFGKVMRSYDPQEVDTFLDLVGERMEEGWSPLITAPMELDLSGGRRLPRENTAGSVPSRSGVEPTGSAAPGELWLSGLPDAPPAVHEEAGGKEWSG